MMYDEYGAFRAAALGDLGEDLFLGFMSAYFRTFAVPRIARTLCESGVTERSPDKRAADTGIVIYEILTAGFDSPRSAQMIALLASAHQRVNAPAADYLYVLLSLYVVPTRWVRVYGRRDFTEPESQQAFDFYCELGRRMGLSGLPSDPAEAELFFDEYEASTVAHSPYADRLLGASMGVLRRNLPWFVRPMSRTMFSGLVGDARVCAALGVTPARPWFMRLMASIFSVRAALLKHAPAPRKQFFIAGSPVPGVYPHGYDLNEVGPDE